MKQLKDLIFESIELSVTIRVVDVLKILVLLG